LYQRSDKNDPKNYFRFEELFPIAYLGAQAYREIEGVLAILDSTAWRTLSKKALSNVTADDAIRRYHQLFNILNEARGYAYLAEDDCERIEFIEDITCKSPDLLAKKNGSTVLLEVKTLNQSDEGIKNETLHKKEAIKVEPLLSRKLKTRIKRSIRDAREQLERYSLGADRKIVFLFLEMESSQRTCFESYLHLKSFIAEQNSNELKIVGIASPMMLRF
jgi:hypothetical protein